MLTNSSFSNLVNELPMPIAQNETAMAIVIEIATMMMVEITMLMPFLLFLRFRFKAFPTPIYSVMLNGFLQSELERSRYICLTVLSKLTSRVRTYSYSAIAWQKPSLRMVKLLLKARAQFTNIGNPG